MSSLKSRHLAICHALPKSRSLLLVFRPMKLSMGRTTLADPLANDMIISQISILDSKID